MRKVRIDKPKRWQAGLIWNMRVAVPLVRCTECGETFTFDDATRDKWDDWFRRHGEEQCVK